MIDFTTPQLSWIVIGALGVGGTGYLSMEDKVNQIDKKVAVSIKQLEDTQKQMDRIEQAINRLEEKSYNKK